MTLQIGIDLGTTNSLIAQFHEGETRLIPNKLGHFLTPSVVSIDADGSVLVGLTARERLRTAPEQTAAAFKRFMGTDKQFRLGTRSFRAEELSALVLKSLKEDAEAFLGESVGEAVITVPAYFNAIQRQATKNAAEMAGLKVSRLLNEPTAAGLAYGLQHKPDDTRLLIYDLGGGTFDVSVLDYFDGVVQVSASAGDNHLGGEDFVQILRQCFIARCEDLSPSEREYVLRSDDCWQAFENAKRTLSNGDRADIELRIGDNVRQASISGADFEKAAEPLLARLRQPLERALRDAKLRADDLSGIILVGGATRMPLIRQFIARLFRRIPQASVNPDEAIARGAAVQAALIARNASVDEVVLTDVMPFSLGTETAVQLENGRLILDRFAPIIERNMPVPVSRVRSFTTVEDNQAQLRFSVLQGESPIASENLQLGEMLLDIPRRKAGEVSIDVRFSYDINGLLEVDLSNADLNIQASQMFRQNSSNLSAEEIEASRRRLAGLKIHPRDMQQNRYLIERAKRLFEDFLGDNRHIISQHLAVFEAVLETQDETAIRRAQKQFADFLDRHDGSWLL